MEDSRFEQKIDRLIEKVNEISERVGRLETSMNHHEKRQELFWAKDWKELTYSITRAHKRLGEVENNIIGIKTKVGVVGAIFGIVASIFISFIDKIFKP